MSGENSNDGVARRDGLNVWRHTILELVLREMLDANSVRLQRSLSVWPWPAGLPLPAINDSYIMAAEGVCSFSVPMRHGRIFFSLLMFLGEVRVRVKVPGAMLGNAVAVGRDVVDEIVTCFDGTSCDRVASTNSDTLFDWIFKDKTIASSALMMRGLGGDEEASALIADGIAKVLAQIYWSVMNILVGHGLSAADGHPSDSVSLFLVDARSGSCDDVLRVMGNVAGLEIQRVLAQTGGRHFILASCAEDKALWEALAPFANQVTWARMEAL